MFGRRLKNYSELIMDDWTVDDLEAWDDRIQGLASNYDLDWYPIVYEICDYYDMIGHMSYHGMPSHYSHWSFGKSFERTHQMYNLGMQGLPYELIINSNPSIAYLMRENPLYLQILIMAHCVGHSDFFKNNLTFKDTGAESVNARFKSAKKRINEYIEDPSIGVEKVEKILDAAHAIQFQTYRWPINRKKHSELKSEYEEMVKNDVSGKHKNIDLNKFPLEPDYDLIGFISEYSKLEDWEKDILNIVREESHYFIPQMKTKIINEGWASFWHYKLMNELELPQKFHLPFLKSHNQVIRPHIGSLNPYHLGFHIFMKIEEKYGLERCFFAREICHDQSFIREYLDLEDGIDLNLFTYSKKKRDYYSIDGVSNENDWKSVKNTLINNIGMSPIPRIFVEEVEKENCLILSHEHDGRDLEIQYANKVVEHIKTLWSGTVKLYTVVEDEAWIID
jgi:stage V sporulation protein R